MVFLQKSYVYPKIQVSIYDEALRDIVFKLLLQMKNLTTSTQFPFLQKNFHNLGKDNFQAIDIVLNTIHQHDEQFPSF